MKNTYSNIEAIQNNLNDLYENFNKFIICLLQVNIA